MDARCVEIVLRPVSNVEDDNGFVATSDDPWLGVESFDAVGLRGRFVTLIYRSSLWDAPARPVLRFLQEDGGTVERIAGAPIVGAGSWTGRVPHGTVRLLVSPTNRPGRFVFAVERVRRERWLGLLLRGLRNWPRATRSAILTRLIGWRPESDVNLTWAIGSTALDRFGAWRRARTRPLDLAGFDRPRFAWDQARPMRLVVRHDGRRQALERTLDALRAQVFTRWRAVVVPDPLFALAADARITTATTSDDLDLGGTHDWTCVLSSGDILDSTALAIVAERGHADPECLAFYGDAVVPSEAGGMVPLLKPGWSPRLQKASPYIDDWLFVRDLAGWPGQARSSYLSSGVISTSVLDTLRPGTIQPLHRIMGTLAPRFEPRRAPVALPAPSMIATAAIVIPTRDHPSLLSRLIASIRTNSRSGIFQIVVVDNGSVDAETKVLLDTLRRQPDVLVISHPGSFNFSLMCNEAARASCGDVLVFLNDDTEVKTGDWLDRLAAHALAPSVGAVGAKLTYPDGRIQHIGVLVGMGESAGHFGSLAPGDDPGWANRNLVVHEVTAVTGACLAVAREKFEVVGGFDATHLPVELSDIDLCLRLNERGWQTIVDPSVHLLHEESASRGGATLRRLAVYDRERAIFVERWHRVLRDDPTFHPGLSLYRWQAALG